MPGAKGGTVTESSSSMCAALEKKSYSEVERENGQHIMQNGKQILGVGLSMIHPNVLLACRSALLRLDRQQLCFSRSHETCVPDVAEVLPGLHTETRKR